MIDVSKYDAFRKRVQASGSTQQESFMNSSKRQTNNYISNSPTRSEVEILELLGNADKSFSLVTIETKDAIVSDKENFHKRIVLFRPDEDVSIGTYLKYDGKIYLTTDISDIDGYPQAFVEHCNHTIQIKGEEIKIQVGKDSLGRPKYETQFALYDIPVVASSKIYSVLDNSQIPLPEGAIMIYAPYREGVDIPTNHIFHIHGDEYKVTTVNKINVLTDEFGSKSGYLEVRGQRDVNKT